LALCGFSLDVYFSAGLFDVDEDLIGKRAKRALRSLALSQDDKDERQEKQVPHRAWRPVRNDIPIFIVPSSLIPLAAG
jgi:hypothetical protein